VLERLAYLNAGTFGPLPLRTAEAVARAVERDLRKGRSSRSYFENVLALREQARAALGRVLGVSAETVALTTSTTEACNVVINGLRIGSGDQVVTTDSEHPGLFGGLKASGATLHIAEIRSRPSGEALAALEALLDERTRLIALSHVSWLTGAVLPVAELSGRGVPVLVDGAQAAGAIPVDVASLDCDFYTVSAQKWLLGPDATGCLYVRPDRVDELRLAMPSYMSWEHGTYEPRAGALRFDPSWIATGSLAGLLASLEFAEGAGEERFAHARAMAERCRELVAELAEPVTESGQATLVSWRAAGDAEAAAQRLEEAGVVVRDLPGTGWLRASCGFWTSDDDLERLVAAL
jgi:L-cysteine/cystine lyase